MYLSGSSPGTLAFSSLTTDASAQNYLSGIVTSTEGIYYTWYQGTSDTYNQYTYTGNMPGYACPYQYYGYEHDYNSFEALMRYQYAVILKIIVDDPQVFPPENKMNIPDITPTVGQRYKYPNIDTYFTTTCAYYKVK